MIRSVLTVAVVLAMASAASASLHVFNATGIPPGELNILTVVGSNVFGLAGPDADPMPNQYGATLPFDVQVVADTGPKLFTLDRGSTTEGHVNLLFFTNNNADGQLLIQFDVPGIVQGSPIPAAFNDADGVVEWNAPWLKPPSSARNLAGTLYANVTAVPEPSALAFGGLAIGLVGVGRVVRRKFRKEA